MHRHPHPEQANFQPTTHTAPARDDRNTTAMAATPEDIATRAIARPRRSGQDEDAWGLVIRPTDAVCTAGKKRTSSRRGCDDDDMPRLDERSISGVGTLCHDAGPEAPVTASALTLQLAQLEQM
ncbi:hypothetical protein L1887_41916 [Cichorium endivia]|nr:hypothetical protein L1887_41916 [Cichorium endivia]